MHPHTLRHSFATHLIENGYAVTEVQPLLGHRSINTTMTYLHMASPTLLNVKSPYDGLEEMETTLISEKSLSKDWLSKKDEEAWKDL